MEIGIDKKDPSTLCGGITAIGTTTALISFLLPSHFSFLITPLSLLITAASGVVFVITKNYGKTDSKLDDAVHNVAGILSGQKD